MKKKINIYFVIVTFAAIVFTMLLSTIAYYQIFTKEVIRDLKNDVYMLKDSGVFDEPDKISLENDDNSQVRISLISPDGAVCYDNEVEVNSLDNHNNRPEVEQALHNGEGSSVRKSDTIDKNAFYYALKIENGYIIRVAKESGSIWSVFAGILPMIAIIAVVIFVVTFILTHLLTKGIVSPIEQMANNLDDLSEVVVYKELKPFVAKIKTQHDNIMQSAQMRQDFTANVSHELKTPLTAISGYSELIENGMAKEDDIQRFAKSIHKNSARLLNLINDIIHLSELDVMEEKPDMEEVDIFHIARTAGDMLQMSADKHGVLLGVTGIPAMVMANRGMMEEVVYNLIDNAIRYNRANGSVRVHVYTDGNIVELSVKDTGIGISQENQERIFERFYRVDKSRSKSTGGTGLGLAIVKHILSLHDAKIDIDSEVGEGTTITVTMKAVK